MRRLLAALFLILPITSCNDYNISEVSTDDDDVSQSDGIDDESPWTPSFNPHVPDVNIDPDPDPEPEWSAGFLVIDKHEFGIGGERYRNIFTIDEDANIINSIGLSEPVSIAFDNENDLLLAVSVPSSGDPRIVTAGSSGFIADIILPIVPMSVDFAHPYIVAKSSAGMIAYQNVLTGDTTLSYPVDRDWVSSAFKIADRTGVAMFDMESACIVLTQPESGINSDHLCDIEMHEMSALGSDDSGNIYIGYLGGLVNIHRSTGGTPINLTLPSTHRVIKIASASENAAWVYTAESTDSSAGFRMFVVGVDESIEEIFHVIPDPWIDLEVID